MTARFPASIFGTIGDDRPYLVEPRKSADETLMNTLPIDRTLSIYETLADHSVVKGTRERLSKHLMKMYLDGEKDPHRLTVHGLAYLRSLDREINSRH